MNALLDRKHGFLVGATIVVPNAGGDTELSQRLRSSFELGARHVVVDLGETEMLDSATLAAFKRLSGRLRARGGDLSVVCPHPGLTNLLELTLLNRSFAVFGTLGAALRHAAA